MGQNPVVLEAITDAVWKYGAGASGTRSRSAPAEGIVDRLRSHSCVLQSAAGCAS